MTLQSDGEVIEGALVCPEPRCLREHPIVDGIPILVPDVRSYVSHQLEEIRARRDLSPFMQSLLGDCAGPGSAYDQHRYQTSSYAREHYGDLDPDSPLTREGGILSLFEAALSLLSAPPSGCWLDAGCAVGRTTFELAARTDELVLGVDLSFAMLRVARGVLSQGRARHPLRRLGLVYDQPDFPAELPARERVDFWACDVTLLPFAPASFSGVLDLNLLDCVASPLAHLAEVGRVLEPGGEVVLAAPYDWSANATPVEQWLGGHSQRGEGAGDSAAELRRLLAPGDPAGAGLGLELVRERERLPWRVYVHERATMHYQVHLATARRLPG